MGRKRVRTEEIQSKVMEGDIFMDGPLSEEEQDVQNEEFFKPLDAEQIAQRWLFCQAKKMKAAFATGTLRYTILEMDEVLTGGNQRKHAENLCNAIIAKCRECQWIAPSLQVEVELTYSLTSHSFRANFSCAMQVAECLGVHMESRDDNDDAE